MADYGQSGQDYGGYHGDISGGGYGMGNPNGGQGGEHPATTMPVGGFMNVMPHPQPTPFQFLGGAPAPHSFMPQIAPSLMSNPQTLDQLYAAYGMSPNTAMTPSFMSPPPAPSPVLPGRIRSLLAQYPQLMQQFPQFFGGM